MRLHGTQRLLIVATGTALTWWLLWPWYRDALDQIGQQLRNSGSDARAADEAPRRYRRMQCTGSMWSDRLQCGPWQDGPAPESRRGGER